MKSPPIVCVKVLHKTTLLCVQVYSTCTILMYSTFKPPAYKAVALTTDPLRPMNFCCIFIVHLQ